MAKKKTTKRKKKVAEIIWHTYYLKSGQVIHIDGIPLEVQQQTRVRTATPMPFLERKNVYL